MGEGKEICVAWRHGGDGERMIVMMGWAGLFSSQ